jgi:hypothetical protein
LIAAENLRLAVPSEQDLLLLTIDQNTASMLLLINQLNTQREYQSTITTG